MMTTGLRAGVPRQAASGQARTAVRNMKGFR